MTTEELTETYPAGTPCAYHSRRREDGHLDEPGKPTRIRSEFWALPHGRQVVLVEGVTGCVAFDHLMFTEGQS